MEKDLRGKIVDILEDIYGYEADDVVNKLLALLSPTPEWEKCRERATFKFKCGCFGVVIRDNIGLSCCGMHEHPYAVLEDFYLTLHPSGKQPSGECRCGWCLSCEMKRKENEVKQPPSVPKGWPKKVPERYPNGDVSFESTRYNRAIDDCLQAHNAIVAEKDKKFLELIEEQKSAEKEIEELNKKIKEYLQSGNSAAQDC